MANLETSMSMIETDTQTTSSLVTIKPSTDAARRETVDEDCAIYNTHSVNSSHHIFYFLKHFIYDLGVFFSYPLCELKLGYII